MGVNRCVRAFRHMVGIQKYVGIQTYGGVQTYGSVQTLGVIQTYWGIQTYGRHPNIWACPNIFTLYIYQNNPINFVEIKFSLKIHVDTMKMEHSQSGNVCGCPNNILR